MHFASAVRQSAAPWLIDVVQAYTSVAAFFDPEQTRYRAVVEYLHDLDRDSGVRVQLTANGISFRAVTNCNSIWHASPSIPD